MSSIVTSVVLLLLFSAMTYALVILSKQSQEEHDKFYKKMDKLEDEAFKAKTELEFNKVWEKSLDTYKQGPRSNQTSNKFIRLKAIIQTRYAELNPIDNE